MSAARESISWSGWTSPAPWPCAAEWVLERKVDRKFVPEEDQVDVVLRQGANEILLKVENGSESWGFALQAHDARGWPARLTWKTRP